MIPDEKSDGEKPREGKSQKSERAKGTSPMKEVPKRPLTPEEQMAQYEEALKESDWGHQPC